MFNFQNFSPMQWIAYLILAVIFIALVIQIILWLIGKFKKGSPTLEKERVFVSLQLLDGEVTTTTVNKFLKILGSGKVLKEIRSIAIQKVSENDINGIKDSLIHRYIPEPPVEPKKKITKK